MKDATYWANQLKTNQISFTELVDSWGKIYQEKNAVLNAITQWRPDIATTSYAKIKAPKATLFGGLPIALKDLGQDKASFLAQSGSRLFNGYQATKTDNFVAQVQRCGLVPLAKTNVPEFGFKNVTDSKLHGIAKNPFDVSKTPGGSSGGAAACVASGIFPLALASDGGGSIRIPASYCGLLGLKPTRGTMPVGPGGLRGWQGASINFALGISVRDIKTLFYGLRQGVNPAAPYQAPPCEWQHDENTKVTRPLKIAFCQDSPVNTPVSADAKAALKKAIDFLSAQGHQITEIAYPLDGEKLIRGYYAMNGAETTAMLANLGFSQAQLQENIEPLSWLIYNYGKHISAATYTQILQEWDQASAQMEELFTKYDLFLSPTTAVCAPDIEKRPLDTTNVTTAGEQELAEALYTAFYDSLAQTPYTQLANLTGQPAISLPVYASKSGLPLGVQAMAAKGREDLLFSVASLFEDAQQFILPPVYH